MGNKAIQDENGNFIIIEVEDPEPDPIFWHEEQINKPIQIIITEETRKDWLIKKQENDYIGTYPEIVSLLEYVKTLQAPKVIKNGNLYIYLDSIFEDHYNLLKSLGIEINGEIIFEV